jgi:hypothetical protein
MILDIYQVINVAGYIWIVQMLMAEKLYVV